MQALNINYIIIDNKFLIAIIDLDNEKNEKRINTTIIKKHSERILITVNKIHRSR